MWVKIVQIAVQVINGLAKLGASAGAEKQGFFVKLVTGIIIASAILITPFVLMTAAVGSPISIFFSTAEEDIEKSNSEVIAEAITSVGTEYQKALEDAKDVFFRNPEIIKYDLGELNNWKEVLAVFAVDEFNSDDPEPVMAWNADKQKRLYAMFEKTHPITQALETVDDVLTLTISAKNMSVDEMTALYSFTEEEISMLNALLSEDMNEHWDDLLADAVFPTYNGGGAGNADIVAVALSQVGNVGGQPYWSWYGYNGWVNWCACFVSWCGNQCGYIDAGIFPKFSACTSGGVKWFKEHGLWVEGAYYTPSPGDVIFIDWNHDGSAEHVELVERVAGTTVYTIGGNRGGGTGKCIQYSFTIGNPTIKGYGTPQYPTTKTEE